MNIKSKALQNLRIVILLSLLASCTKQKSLDTSVQFEVPSLFEYYQEAENLAKQWDQDAVLVRVLAFIASPFTQIPDPSIDFIYESVNRPGETVYVICQNESCNSKAYEIGYSILKEWGSIDLINIQVDSDEIVQAALQNGGDYYLAREGSFGNIRLIWLEEQGNRLVH